MAAMSRIETKAILGLLVARWPKAFVPYPGIVRPLKVGIDTQIHEAGLPISRRQLAHTLAAYVGQPIYLRQIREGATRIGLGGEPAGVVTAHEAEHARKMEQKLAQRRKTKRKERKAKVQPVPEPAKIEPKLSLAGLREAAKRRKEQAA
jgi:ProP effector